MPTREAYVEAFSFNQPPHSQGIWLPSKTATGSPDVGPLSLGPGVECFLLFSGPEAGSHPYHRMEVRDANDPRPAGRNPADVRA